MKVCTPVSLCIIRLLYIFFHCRLARNYTIRTPEDEVNLSMFDLRLFVFLENLYTKQYSHNTTYHTAWPGLALGLGITAWTTIIQEVANLI